MILDSDFRIYNILIISKSSDSEICNNLIKSITGIGIDNCCHTNGTNTLHSYIKIPTSDRQKINELVEQIKRIPNIDHVQVEVGTRQVIKTLHESIKLTDSIQASVTRIIDSRKIKIEENAINNKTQINIYGDNDKLAIYNGTVIYNIDNNLVSHDPPQNVIEEIEKLEQKIQNDNSLGEKDKEYATGLTKKLKQCLSKSKPESFIANHKEKITLVVDITSKLAPYVTLILNLFKSISQN